MFIAALKCDFCGKAHEVPCRKVGDKVEIPNGWALITPLVRIKGTPQGDSAIGEWQAGGSEDGKSCDHVPITKEQKENFKIRKLYNVRRNSLRKKFDKSHVCEDCIEEILTGKKLLKIGFNKENNNV